MNFQFTLTIWGKRYLELFSTLTLPALMTPGNLLGFPGAQCEFDIYTTAESKRALLAMPIVAALADLMDVRITALHGDDASAERKYDRMNEGSALATRRSAQRNSVLFFLTPDGIFADGTLAHTRMLVESGKRAVLLAGARGASGPFLAELRSRFDPDRSWGLQIAPRELARLLLAHPHNSHATWENEPFTATPSHVIFAVGDEGHIIRGFHHHPIAVYPANRRVVPTTSFDGPWLIDAVPNRDDWHLITDSNDACGVDIGTDPDDLPETIGQEDPHAYIARWMSAETDEGHRWLSRRNVYIHRGVRSARWAEAETLAAATFDRIFELYERPARKILALAHDCRTRGLEPVALYGAADLAVRVIDNFTAVNARIAALFDGDDRKQGMRLRSHFVQSPAEIAMVNPGAIVILARGSRAEQAIRGAIAGAGYEGHVVSWRDL